MSFQSTKIIELGSCAFRQWKADSHCKYIHGYRLIGKFWFACNELDNKNWVVDFGGLKELKSILEKQFDHTLCIANDDPLLSSFKELHRVGAADLRIMMDGVGIERTAEWCFKAADEHVRKITNNRCWVEKVEVWEHDKNSAIFTMQKSDLYKDKQKHNADQFEFNFKTTTPPQEHAPIANVVAAPAPEIQKAIHSGYKPAPIGNEVSQGLGNPFKGTSWGS
jgi:6-pyruvoyltetrahydropterin/6-carboxytetrahydropterin synthase